MYFFPFILPIFCHPVGIYLLLKVKHRCDDQPQYWHLLSMSIGELWYCIHSLITGITRECTTNFTVNFVLGVIQNSGMLCFIFLVKLVILLDRFMEIYLHLHYQRLCSLRRTKLVLFCSFLVSIFVTVSCFFAIRSAAEMPRFFVLFFWPPICLIYLGSSVTVYSYIRWKQYSFAKIAIKVYPEPNLSSNPRPNHQQQQRTQKNIFLPNLLVLTFVLFWVLPLVLLFVEHCNENFRLHYGDLIVTCLVMLGLVVDVFLYVMMYRPVRSYLKRNNATRGERMNDLQMTTSTSLG